MSGIYQNAKGAHRLHPLIDESRAFSGQSFEAIKKLGLADGKREIYRGHRQQDGDRPEPGDSEHRMESDRSKDERKRHGGTARQCLFKKCRHA